MIDVVAAIIKKNNKYFIAKRNRNKHLGNQWEFPGGKVEAHEDIYQGLCREFHEEERTTSDTFRGGAAIHGERPVQASSVWCPVSERERGVFCLWRL